MEDFTGFGFLGRTMKAKAMMGKRLAMLLVDIVTTSTIITYFSQKGKQPYGSLGHLKEFYSPR